MGKKKLLIMGANPETAVLVNTAKKMDIFTIVTDNVPNSYAKGIADKAYDIDGMDVDGLVQAARDEKVDGVLVGTADPLIAPYSQVCSKLNLPCYANPEAVYAFTNKRNFKEVCQKFGIKGVPEYTIEEVRNHKVKYPILIKPTDGRSGKGMSVCYCLEEVDQAIDRALVASQCKEFMIERYMECDDVFMYYTFSNGEYYLSAMPDRFTSKEQVGVDPVVLGAVYPSKYLNIYIEAMHAKMCQMFQYLNICNGILLVQAFVEDNEFYVYDPGFRLQGGAPHILIKNINDIDHQRMLIHHALYGDMGDPDIARKNDVLFAGKAAASQVILLKAGTIKCIEGIDKISIDPRVIATTQRLYVGDTVNMIGTEQQILVRFHLVCESFEDLKNLVNNINEVIHVTDILGNEMCLQGLSL